MNILPYSDLLDEYLAYNEVIDYDNKAVAALAHRLFQEADTELSFIKHTYEYVRDVIPHSADIDADEVACTASHVLEIGHGTCFAKSHLFAALLRCKSIPTGFCYQRLAPTLTYHGLSGVYLRDFKKWIRLDARGNKVGIDAQFSLEAEKLAYDIRTELGEEDGVIIYPRPDVNIVKKLRSNKTRSELWNDLPGTLGYNEQE